MKFINYLEGITGIGIFPMISLLLFFAFFMALGVYILRADKRHISYMSELPLNGQEGKTKTDVEL